jgi:hypothetical protein
MNIKTNMIAYCVAMTISCLLFGRCEGLTQESHSIVFYGIDYDKVSSTSIKSDIYDLKPRGFSMLGGDSSGGVIVNGRCPQGPMVVTVVQNGVTYSGHYQIPTGAKNKNAIDEIAFTLKDGSFVGSHKYSDLKDMRGSFDREGVREWSFSETGSVTKVEVREINPKKERYMNEYKVENGRPLLQFVSVDLITSYAYFYFGADGSLDKSLLDKDGIESEYDKFGKFKNASAAKREIHDSDLDVAAKGNMGTDLSLYVIKISDWNSEIKNAGLEW